MSLFPKLRSAFTPNPLSNDEKDAVMYQKHLERERKKAADYIANAEAKTQKYLNDQLLKRNHDHQHYKFNDHDG